MNNQNIRLIVARLMRLESRLRAAEYYLKATRAATAQLVGNQSAQIAAPATPALGFGAEFYARITAPIDPADGRTFYARRVVATAPGLFEDDADDTDVITVVRLPLWWDADTLVEDSMPAGTLVRVRWDGITALGGPIYHVVESPTEQRFRIMTADHENYYTCRALLSDGTLDATSVRVARPFEFTGKNYHGKTVNGVAFAWTGHSARTATPSGGTAESQILVPRYQFTHANQVGGDEIVAGLFWTGITTVDSRNLLWGDLNAAGRQWARVPEES